MLPKPRSIILAHGEPIESVAAMKPVILASFLIVAGSCCAAAAVVKSDVVGCRQETDLKRPLPRASTDVGKVSVSAPKITVEPDKLKTGECAPLHRGVSVSIDEKRGDLVCVRPYGGLDCFWTPMTTIDENPSSSRREQRPGPLPLLDNGFRPGVRTSF
jgi:hypothetical protein